MPLGTTISGKIVRTVESRASPGTLLKAEVQCPTGTYLALFGPGLYKILPVGAVQPGQEVLLILKPVPTILGLIKDE